MLGVLHGNTSDYERGELRLHGELLVKLARILKVSADEILDKLSKRDREALVRTLDAFLSKTQPG